MHALFITASHEPFSTGPAAEFCGALPKGLRALDLDVSVLSPLYRGIEPQDHSLARRLTKVEVEHEGERYACEIYTGRTVSGVATIFLGHETLFHEVTSLDEGDDAAVARRAAVFAAAAVHIVNGSDSPIDVVHGHGWVGAASLAALAEAGSTIPRVLTLHGETGPLADPATKAGAGVANRVTVGSSRYAAELAENLGLPEERVVGIPAGIDGAIWNPITDAHLPARFDPVDLSGKHTCKTELQRELGLPVRPEVPLLTVDGAPGGDDGLALLVKVASQLLRNDVQMAILASDDEDGELVAAYEELWDRWPDRIQVRTRPSAQLRHRAYAGTDLMLIGHRRAGSGADAMRAHRYGAVPIAHETGALADAIVDCDPRLETGTGFLFSPHSPEMLLGAAQRGFTACADRGAFDALVRRIMRLDHSWERGARLFDRLYASLFDEDDGD